MVSGELSFLGYTFSCRTRRLAPYKHGPIRAHALHAKKTLGVKFKTRQNTVLAHWLSGNAHVLCSHRFYQVYFISTMAYSAKNEK